MDPNRTWCWVGRREGEEGHWRFTLSKCSRTKLTEMATSYESDRFPFWSKIFISWVLTTQYPNYVA